MQRPFKFIVLCLALLFALATGQSSGGLFLYISTLTGSNNNSNGCTSFIAPCQTITWAVQQLNFLPNETATLWIAGGLYSSDCSSQGLVVDIMNQLTIYGGWVEGTLSSRNTSVATVVDCKASGTFLSFQSLQAVVQGLTVNNALSTSGAGTALSWTCQQNSTSQPCLFSMSNCSFNYNIGLADSNGGGAVVVALSASPTVGSVVSNANVTVLDCMFINNQLSATSANTESYGGALAIAYNSVAANCTTKISGGQYFWNKATSGLQNNGGAVSVYFAYAATNCTTIITGGTYISNVNAVVWSVNTIAFAGQTTENLGGAVSIFFSDNAASCQSHVIGGIYVNNSNSIVNISNPNGVNTLGGAVSIYYGAQAFACSTSIIGGNYTTNSNLISGYHSPKNYLYAVGGAVSVFYNSIAENCTSLSQAGTFDSNSITVKRSDAEYQAATQFAGAYSISYNGNSTVCNDAIRDGMFLHNYISNLENSFAVEPYGGAVTVAYNYNSNYCNVTVLASVFTNNSIINVNQVSTVITSQETTPMISAGAALAVWYDYQAQNCKVFAANNTFTSNQNLNKYFANSNVYGGAVAIFYNTTAVNSTSEFINCSFISNGNINIFTAVSVARSAGAMAYSYGGALSVFYYQSVWGCSSRTTACHFRNNYNTNNIESSSSSFSGSTSTSTTEDNIYNYGGALSVASYQDINSSFSISENDIFINNSHTNGNSGYGGAASFFHQGYSTDHTNRISGGFFDSNSNDGASTYGGGAAVNMFQSSNCILILTNNTFVKNVGISHVPGNVGISSGGAVGLFLGRSDGLHATVTNNTFQGNQALQAGQGGALHVSIYSARMANLTFSNNLYMSSLAKVTYFAHSYGGGANFDLADIQNSTLLIINSDFNGNYASRGGAVNFQIEPATYQGLVLRIVGCNFSAHHTSDGVLVLATPRVAVTSNLSIEIIDCQFTSNTATVSGGAIDIALGPLSFSSVTVRFCRFFQNIADSGGSVYLTGSLLGEQQIIWQSTVFLLEDCHFQENSVTGTGGAIYIDSRDCSNVNVQIRNCEFLSNEAEQGAGIYITSNAGSDAGSDGKTWATLTSNGFSGNSASLKGGDLWVSGWVDLNLTGNIFQDSQVGDQAAASIFILSNIPLYSASIPTCRMSNNTFSSNHINNQISINQVSLIGADCGSSVAHACALGSTNSCSVTGNSWTLDCTECAKGTYQVQECAGRACQPCPPGAQCIYNESAIAEKNYWTCPTVSDCQVSVFRCPEGFCDADNNCISGHVNDPNNTLCGKCEPFRSRVGAECKDCRGDQGGRWFGMAVAYLVMAGLIVILGAVPDLTASKKTFFYFFQTLYIVLGPTSSW
jgi:hypothetical protein